MGAAGECLICGAAESQQNQTSNTSLMPVLAGLLGQHPDSASTSSCCLCRRCHSLLSEVGVLEQRLGQLKEAILSIYRSGHQHTDATNGGCSMSLPPQLVSTDPANTISVNLASENQGPMTDASSLPCESSSSGDGETSGCLTSSDNTAQHSSAPAETDTSESASKPVRGQKSRRLPCPTCGKSVTARYLRDHQRQHSGERPFPCPLCARAFAKSGDLTTHVRRHAGDRRHRCSQCPAAFFFPHELAAHRHRHGDARPHLCPTCGAGFLSRAGLLRHQRTSHADERAARRQCEQCGKRFACAQSLRRHERAHGAATRYMCEACGAAYRTSTALRFHTRRHHSGERPYQCEVCGRQFITRSVWLRHLRVHTGEMPFRCQFCGTEYKDKQKLKRHYANKHAEEVQKVGVENLKYAAGETPAGVDVMAPPTVMSTATSAAAGEVGVDGVGAARVDGTGQGQDVIAGQARQVVQLQAASADRVEASAVDGIEANDLGSGRGVSDLAQGEMRVEMDGSDWSAQWKEAGCSGNGHEYGDASATVADAGTASAMQSQEMAVDMMQDSSVLTQGMLFEAHSTLFNYF